MSQESVDAKTLREWLERGERVTVVDVRHAEEHAEWSVPESVNLDAYDDKLKAGDPDAMEGLDAPKDGPLVTVCGAGRSSAVAAEHLRERGYEALTLEGGMKAWSLAWNSAEVEVPGTEARVVQVRRTGKVSEHPGAGEVVGVDVGVQDMGDLPSAFLGQLEVNLRVHGRVDYRRLAPGADQIREAPLAGAPDLDYSRFRTRDLNLCTVPG